MWIMLAVSLAWLGSLAELITKYENKLLKHIVNRYLITYLLFNGLLAFIFYLCLPQIGTKILAPELATIISEDGWQRSLLAGLGYLFILRSKIFNMDIGGKEIPLGPEAIYLALSKYLINNTTRIIRSVERDIVMRMIKEYPKIPTFKVALETLIIQEKNPNLKETLQTRIDKIMNDPNMPEYNKLFALGTEILEIVGSKEEMEKLLGRIPGQ
jgi:uncharacterized protein (UPF0147 family)